MKLNNYIIVSLLSHILLFGVFMVFHPEMNTEASASIFDVDIVGSIGEERTVPGAIKIPVRQSLSVPQKSIPKSILDEPPPKAMFGEGIDSIESGGKTPNQQAFNGLNSSSHNLGITSSDKEGVLPEGPKGPLRDESPTLEPKSFLFDKETIEKYARKNPTDEKSLTFDVPEFHHRGYMRMLKEKIESIWEYPKEAARRGISGDLYIRFSIRRDGSIEDVELVRTSGYKDLDEAAMKALKDAEPYWPLPDDWKGEELSISGHFIYLIGRFYIM